MLFRSGRFSRNLFEHAINAQANRLIQEERHDLEALQTLEAADINVPGQDPEDSVVEIDLPSEALPDPEDEGPTEEE